jgi:long-chain acyl-CoA synthetase
MRWDYLVPHILETAADHWPDKAAVLHKGVWTTYGELDSRSNQIAWLLADHGIVPGDRVVIACENSVTFVIAYFGALKAGAVAVPVSPNGSVDGFAHALAHSQARGLIAGAKAMPRLEQVGPADAGLKLCISDVSPEALPRVSAAGYATIRLAETLSACPANRPNVKRIDKDLESIMYTSGSTGRPKGVMLTHLNTLSNMRSIAEYLELSDTDRVMVVLPFSYIYGKSLLLTHILVGGSLVIDDRFAFPNVVLDAMIETAVTGFAGVPSTFSLLLANSRVRSLRFPALRYVTQAGGAMSASLQKEVAQVFDPARLYVMYGATEAGPRLSYLNPADLQQKWGSVGKAIPNVELGIVDEQGSEVPSGEIGEIVARGSNITQGYWRDPEGTAEVLRNGIYRTGDLGRRDEEGFLYITGRARETIKIKGFRVSAAKIEDALTSVEEIAEAAVISMNDEILGEAPCAFVVLRPGRQLCAETIRQLLSSRLQSHELPKVIEFCRELPKNSSGKVMKSLLKPSGAHADDKNVSPTKGAGVPPSSFVGGQADAE